MGAWVAALEQRDDLGDVRPEEDDGVGSDPDRSGRSGGRIAGLLEYIHELPVDGGDAGQELLADWGEADAAAGALEQTSAESHLEQADHLAYARCAHPELLGGAAEVKLLGHGHERAELGQISQRPHR